MLVFLLFWLVLDVVQTCGYLYPRTLALVLIAHLNIKTAGLSTNAVTIVEHALVMLIRNT